MSIKSERDVIFYQLRKFFELKSPIPKLSWTTTDGPLAIIDKNKGLIILCG